MADYFDLYQPERNAIGYGVFYHSSILTAVPDATNITIEPAFESPQALTLDNNENAIHLSRWSEFPRPPLTLELVGLKNRLQRKGVFAE